MSRIVLPLGALSPGTVPSAFKGSALLVSASSAALSRSGAASSSSSRAAACAACSRATMASARRLSRRGSCGSLSDVGWHAGSCALGLLAAAEGAWVTASSLAAAAASSRRASSRRLADRFSCLLRFLRSALVRAGGAPVAASEDGGELSSLSAVETGDRQLFLQRRQTGKSNSQGKVPGWL